MMLHVVKLTSACEYAMAQHDIETRPILRRAESHVRETLLHRRLTVTGPAGTRAPAISVFFFLCVCVCK